MQAIWRPRFDPSPIVPAPANTIYDRTGETSNARLCTSSSHAESGAGAFSLPNKERAQPRCHKSLLLRPPITSCHLAIPAALYPRQDTQKSKAHQRPRISPDDVNHADSLPSSVSVRGLLSAIRPADETNRVPARARQRRQCRRESVPSVPSYPRLGRRAPSHSE